MVKGRSSNLIKLRNEALLRRYYYWTEIRRLRFDDTYRILSEEEFFLSIDRIRAIIHANLGMLDNMEIKPSPRVRRSRPSRQLSLFKD
jgi:hypothetical protein